METPRNFEIKVGERSVDLQIGRCAVVLFRQQQEVSYIAIEMEDDNYMRIFNNRPFAEWLAGYKLIRHEESFARPTARLPYDGIDQTFREVAGWNAVTIEKEQPSDWELDLWTEVNTEDLDKGLGELLG
jgi:hypothetical protein